MKRLIGLMIVMIFAGFSEVIWPEDSSVLTDSNISKVDTQINIDNRKEHDYIIIPFELSFVPIISTSGMLEEKVINYVSLNLIAGYAAKLHGFEAGMINIKSEEVAGLQAAYILNYSGGNTYGFQGSGFANVTLKNLKGVQDGILNYTGGIEGAQFGVINFSLSSASAQAGIINIASNENYLQAGVVNLLFDMEGIQIGEVNIVNHFNGVQAGLVNLSVGKSSGLQLGLLNYSQDIDGAPIGLISIVKDGFTHGFSWYDESGFVNIGIKHGTKNIYNIYGVGLDTSYKYFKATWGLGGHIDFDNIYLNIDGTVSSIEQTTFDTKSYCGNLSSIRIAAGYQIFEHLSLTAGISFNYMADYGQKITINPVTGYKFPMGNDQNQFWPGFFVGLEY